MMRILVVEDHDGVAMILTKFYRQIASVIRVSKDLPTTMHMLTAEQFDLISLDLVLKDGPSHSIGRRADQTLEAIPKMKQLNPDAIIVIVTGLATKEDEEKAMRLGVDGFMTKMAVMESENTFMGALRRIFHTITQKPTRYEKNIQLLERVVEKIVSLEQPTQ